MWDTWSDNLLALSIIQTCLCAWLSNIIYSVYIVYAQYVGEWYSVLLVALSVVVLCTCNRDCSSIPCVAAIVCNNAPWLLDQWCWCGVFIVQGVFVSTQVCQVLFFPVSLVTLVLPPSSGCSRDSESHSRALY